MHASPETHPLNLRKSAELPLRTADLEGLSFAEYICCTQKKVKICHYYYVVLALRDTLYRDVAKLFQAVSGASGGRCGYKHEVGGMAQMANGHLLTMSLNMVKCCCNVEKQNLKVL